ncbi:MAG: SDR family oxidoreductase [Alphaproteobacteria bacterium]
MHETKHIGVYRGIEGKRVLVTGAGRGMGKMVALGFIRNGARVHICDVDRSRLDAFKKEEPSIGTSLTDISDPAQVDGLFGDIDRSMSGLDIVMNNTGIGGPRGPIEDVAIDDWNQAMAVNVNGAFHVVRRAVPMIKAAGGGSIVINASTSGLMGHPYSITYAATKFAVVGMARSLAMELGGHGIRVNTICPGPVFSTRQEERMKSEAQAQGISVREARERYFMTFGLSLSLPNVIDAEDIANMVLFVCSDAGSKITGQSLRVDGDTQTLVEPPPMALLLKADPSAKVPQTDGRYLEEAKARFHGRYKD